MKVYRFKENYHVNRWRLALVVSALLYAIAFVHGCGVLVLLSIVFLIRQLFRVYFGKEFIKLRIVRSAKLRAIRAQFKCFRIITETCFVIASGFWIAFLLRDQLNPLFVVKIDQYVVDTVLAFWRYEAIYSSLPSASKLECQYLGFAIFFPLFGLCLHRYSYFFLSMFWNDKFFKLRGDRTYDRSSFVFVSVNIFVIVFFSLFYILPSNVFDAANMHNYKFVFLYVYGTFFLSCISALFFVFLDKMNVLSC